MNDSLSIFARGLAAENLSFSFDANAETAMFDVKNRHLVMPIWDVSETVQTMLIAHEISHALWTPHARSEELLAEAEKQGYNKTILHRIANVVEDVRIEKLMKQKYPGTRRDFYLGYKEIVDRDLFKLKQLDWTKADLVQRMNAHHKFGVPGFLSITLSDAEQRIADAIDRVTTFDQTIAVAKILYDHPDMADKIKEAIEKMTTGAAEGESDSIPGDMGGSLGKKNGAKYVQDSITISPLSNIEDQIITTATMLEQYEKYADLSRNPLNLNDYRKFVRESDAFVRQLVAQFERKKAADEIRRERPKQTGMLNLDRLHQYRTHDDIFLSKIVKQEGKNHGIVFLIDCSGSMDSVFGDCLLQVLQLVWFCEKAKIPFEVFGFTDCYHPDHREQQEKALKEYREKNPEDVRDEGFTFFRQGQLLNGKKNSVITHDTKLIQFATSQDSAEKREQLLAYLYESCVMLTRKKEFRYGGTPTVEAVLMVSQFMQKWVTGNNIQIPTLMVVTDGCPNGVWLKETQVQSNYSSTESHNIIVNNEIFNTVLKVNLNDYPGLDLSNAIMSTLLDSLRVSLNARCVGMYVGARTFSEHLFAAYCLTRREREDGVAFRGTDFSKTARFAAAKEQYTDGALLLPECLFPGYDAYFLVKTPKIVKDEDAIADSGTYTRIKNTFIRTMTKRGASRVFLSRYVDIVAGQPLRKMDGGIYNQPM